MLKIAIVDDDAVELGHTHAIVTRYFHTRCASQDSDFSVRSFPSSEAFLADMEAGGRSDVYILDIVMPELNGIGLGVRIKEADPAARIIYLTGSAEYGVESYEVQAVDYCLKPCSEERLYRALDRVTNALREEDRGQFIINVRGGIYALPMAKILYVEYYDHRLLVHTVDGQVLESAFQRESFASLIAPLMARKEFVRISTSFVIHMRYVEKLRAHEFVMRGGQQLPISRTYQDCRSIYMDYVLGNG